MADPADAPPEGAAGAFALTPTGPKKRRGRPAGSKAGARVEKKAETPQQRIDRLRAELQKAEEDKAALERQRESIVGKAVLAHARAHPDYHKQLASLLRNEVKAKADLAILDELLA